MAERPHFLVIGGDRSNYWHEVLGEVLGNLGSFLIESDKRAIERLMEKDYDLVVIDSGAVENMPLLVSRIRSQRPNTAVVVASDSADWMKARKAFQAGATDFVWKTFDRNELSKIIQVALKSVKRLTH